MSNLDIKKALVTEITEKFNSAQTAVLVNYRGLTVEEVTDLRSKAREAGVDYKVYKNTFMRFAVKEAGFEGLLEHLTGPTAIAFCDEDPVAAAKVINDFAKTHKTLEIKGGLVNGSVLDIDGVKSLADLPPRDVLIAKVLGGLNAPIYGLANVLNGNLRGLVVALNAIKEKKEVA